MNICSIFPEIISFVLILVTHVDFFVNGRSDRSVTSLWTDGDQTTCAIIPAENSCLQRNYHQVTACFSNN